MKAQLSKAHQTIADNNTPFVVCLFGSYELRLYWYGRSVLGVLWGDYDEERKTTLVSYHTAVGGGYCKESHMLELLFRDTGSMPKGMNMGGGGIPWDYKVGGNFFKVPLSAIRKYK